MMGRRSDKLLELAFLTDKEVESLQADVEALQAGRITGVVETPFWQRAMAEMTRRQTMAQINLARRMVQATWALVFSHTVTCGSNGPGDPCEELNGFGPHLYFGHG